MVVLVVCIAHIVYLHKATCTQHDKLNTTCVCTITNSTNVFFNESYHYQDLSCEEVNCFLMGIVAMSCVLNMLSIILEVMYLCVHAKDASKRYNYVKVPLRDHQVQDRWPTLVFSNLKILKQNVGKFGNVASVEPKWHKVYIMYRNFYCIHYTPWRIKTKKNVYFSMFYWNIICICFYFLTLVSHVAKYSKI